MSGAESCGVCVNNKKIKKESVTAFAAMHCAECCLECVRDECNFVGELMKDIVVDVGSRSGEMNPVALAVYSINWDDVTCVEEESCMAVKDIVVTEKFDTAASKSMSGVPGRINAVDVDHNIVIKGFNDAQSSVDQVGINKDGITEYYVSGMPNNLALLSANDYVENGAAILFHMDGVVLQLSEQEQQKLREFIGDFSVSKRLRVRNRTYEVVKEDEEAYAASNYFNTKVNVSTKEELVLVYMLTGLSLRDLQAAISEGSITGFHPELKTAVLSNFESKWGRTPDVVHLAHPNKMGNVKGYMTEPRKFTRCGELVEIDNMESDFNEGDTTDEVATVNANSGSIRKRVRKLPTHGGAIAANVTYDVYSGFVHGRLIKSMANAVTWVRETVELYDTAGYKIGEMAADRGIIHEGKFRVSTPEVIAYLLTKNVKFSGAEPYNHANGTPHVERIIGVIKEKIRMAVQYILRNPNLKYLGFSTQQILQLWGELFYWAITVINLKECPTIKGITRYEMFTGKKPNIQEIRLLPIFSVLMVLREEPNAAALDGANRRFFQYGLYVGPDSLVTGGIRVAVLTNKRLNIVTSSKYKCVTDGGSLNSYPQVQRGLRQLIEEEVREEEEEKTGETPDQRVSQSTPISLPISPIVGTQSASDGSRDSSTRAVLDDTSTSESIGTGSELRGDNTSNIRYGTRPEVVTGRIIPEDSLDEQTGSSGVKRRKQRYAEKKKQRGKKKEINRDTWGSREERYMRRSEAANYVYEEKTDISTSRQLFDACFADWSTVKENGYYYSVTENAFYTVSMDDSARPEVQYENGYRAVTKGIPKNYDEALQHSEWGIPARKEWNTLMEAKTIVQVDTEMAKNAIKEGADLVVIFPVYEEKEKEGELVKKVRLVGDGRTHYGATATYSATPSREELLVILHLVAKFKWSLVHIDEVRAFLNATYKGEKVVYAKLKGVERYYEILKALYGLKTSPRDYGTEVDERLRLMRFKPLLMSPKLYVLRDLDDGSLILVYDFVDDFIMTGNNVTKLQATVEKFRELCTTTPPIWDPTNVLGMELVRDYSNNTIRIYMRDKIRELAERFNMTNSKIKHVPIPQSGYLVHDHHFDELSEEKKALLDKKGREKYMQIVGSLIWLNGVRLDIIFATTYLSWFTMAPRQHHMDMALYVVSYLYHSIDIPLVLGGNDDVGIIGATDASLGTGPKGRSISSVFMRLGSKSGGVIAKSNAGHTVSLSSFEAELDACSRGMKVMRFLVNLLKQLSIDQNQPVLNCDNQAMIGFVKGEGVAKGVRHMELRMWYTREQYRMHNFNLEHMSGKIIPADKFTKLGDRLDHQEFLRDVQGLGLLLD